MADGEVDDQVEDDGVPKKATTRVAGTCSELRKEVEEVRLGATSTQLVGEAHDESRGGKGAWK